MTFRHLALGLSIHALMVAAQPQWDWVRSAPDATAKDLVTDALGYSFAAHGVGNTPFMGNDLLPAQYGVIAKYDPQGSLLWSVPTCNGGFTRLALKEGVLYAAGYGSGSLITIGDQTIQGAPVPQGSVLLSAFDLDGNLLWNRVDTVTGLFTTTDIEVNSAGEILLALNLSGTLHMDGESISGSSVVPLLMKYAPGGALLWYERPLAVPEAKARIYGVAALSDGGAVITGGFASDTLFFDTIALTRAGMFLARADADGNFQWARDGRGAKGFDVDATTDDSLYVAGHFFEEVEAFEPFTASSIGQDVFLAKAGPDGTFVWLNTTQALLPTTLTWMHGLCVGPMNEAFLMSSVSDGTGDSSSMVMLTVERVAPDGMPVWQVTMDLSAFEDAPPGFSDRGIGCDNAANAYVSCTVRYGDVNYNDTTLVVAPDPLQRLLIARTSDPSTAISVPDPTSLWCAPNPTEGLLRIAGLDPGAVVNFHDIHGRRVQPYPVAPGLYDLSGLSNGIYLVSSGRSVQRVCVAH